MPRARRSSIVRFLLAASLAATLHAAPALAGFDRLYPLLDHDERRELEDLELELDLLKTEYRTRSRVFEMVEALWRVRAVEQEIYLDYERMRDRTKVSVDRAAAAIEQQRLVVAQYDLICEGRVAAGSEAASDSKIDALNREYRRLECVLLGYDVEIAEVDRVFHTAVVEATRSLNAGNVKSKFELVLDEADVERANARVDAYRRRARACKKGLGR